jgi:hypothetical protein
MSVDTEIRNINYKISQLQKKLSGGGYSLIFVSTQTGSLTGSQLNLIGGSNIETSISGNSVQINLNGVVPQPAIYSGSYPSPQYLSPTVSGNADYASDHVLPIHNDDNADIWFTPQFKEIYPSQRQASIGLRGQDAEGAGFHSKGGGNVKIVGGKGATVTVGGDAYVLGGKGGDGAYAQNGGDGGNTYIRGGIPGLAGMGASAGLSGSVYIGDSATNNIYIGNQATTTIISGPSSASGSFSGSFYGTASYATNSAAAFSAVTASYALNLATGGNLSGSAVTASTFLSNVIKLNQQDTLPTGQIGMMACSGSKLYFYDGSWREVSLI